MDIKLTRRPETDAEADTDFGSGKSADDRLTHRIETERLPDGADVMVASKGNILRKAKVSATYLTHVIVCQTEDGTERTYMSGDVYRAIDQNRLTLKPNATPEEARARGWISTIDLFEVERDAAELGGIERKRGAERPKGRSQRAKKADSRDFGRKDLEERESKSDRDRSADATTHDQPECGSGTGVRELIVDEEEERPDTAVEQSSRTAEAEESEKREDPEANQVAKDTSFADGGFGIREIPDPETVSDPAPGLDPATALDDARGLDTIGEKALDEKVLDEKVLRGKALDRVEDETHPENPEGEKAETEDSAATKDQALSACRDSDPRIDEDQRQKKGGAEQKTERLIIAADAEDDRDSKTPGTLPEDDLPEEIRTIDPTTKPDNDGLGQIEAEIMLVIGIVDCGMDGIIREFPEAGARGVGEAIEALLRRGYVSAPEARGRPTYALTEAGRRYLAEAPPDVFGYEPSTAPDYDPKAAEKAMDELCGLT